jgi:hypothetical protein
MRDRVEQARTSGIMRFSQPHDHGESPCLPTHHPRSQPVGASYSVTSCDLRILVDQPAKAISSSDGLSRHDGSWLEGSERRGLPQGPVWTVKVVVVGVLGQHRPQLPAAEISIRSSTSRRTVPTHRSA